MASAGVGGDRANGDHGAMGVTDRTPRLTLIFAGRRFPVDKDRFTIGRKGADLTIPDANVARLHCFIVRQDLKFELVDAGSAGGLDIGGRRVDHHRIRDGETLMLCGNAVEFELREAVFESVATAPELAAALLRRGRIGRWQRVAAIAGDGAAIVATATLVNQKHLAVADPDTAAANVEALAAARPAALIDQAGRWSAPGEVAEVPGFDAAWAAALRHLPRSPFLAGAGPAVGAELTRLRARDSAPITWRRIVAEVDRGCSPLATIREASTWLLVDSAVEGSSLASVPFAALRALRGRASVLDGDGRTRVAAVARAAEDPVETALAVELADELGIDVRAEVMRALLERLDAGWTPDAASPLIAVLLASWRLP
jgi:hypothetical protein